MKWLAELALKFLVWWLFREEKKNRNPMGFGPHMMVGRTAKEVTEAITKTLQSLSNAQMEGLQRMIDLRVVLESDALSRCETKEKFDIQRGQIVGWQSVMPALKKIRGLKKK